MSIKRERVECPKCSGTGVLPWYMHVESGVCFQCSGEGTISGVVDKRFPDESCDQIFNLYKVTDRVVYHAGVYVWHADTGKKYEGTGHVCLQVVVQDGGAATTIEPDNQFHQDLNVVRQYYRDLLDDGYVLLTGDAEDEFIRVHLAPFSRPWQEGLEYKEMMAKLATRTG